jgi:prepilin-type N-terminal cleavage/methylation domain-containing protein
MRRAHHSSRGFTLVELMITAVIGAMVIAFAAMLFSKGTQAAWVTSQRAELQQNFRAAANLLQRDISLAGAGALGQTGLSTSAVALPNGGIATTPVFPCSVVGGVSCTYINGASIAFPTYGGTPPEIYSVIPGTNFGPIINAAQGATDTITLTYADVNLPLNCYTGTIGAGGTSVTFTLPALQPSVCVLPPGAVYGVAGQPPPLAWAQTNPYGLQPGDMILFSGSATAIGVVTNVTVCGANCFTVAFAASDPGKVNQPTATADTLMDAASPAAVGGTMPAAVRLISVTYYLAIPPSTGLPTLYRIQNGQQPAPVAENVVYLKFCYDLNNGTTILTCQSPLPAGTTPSMITKVTIQHMSMRSQNRDSWSRSSLAKYGGYEGLDFQTSIAVRNMTMQSEYPGVTP